MTLRLVDNDENIIPQGITQMNRTIAQNTPKDATNESLEEVLGVYHTISEKNIPILKHHAREAAMDLYKSFRSDMEQHEPLAKLGADHIHEKVTDHFDAFSSNLYDNAVKNFKKHHGIDLEDIIGDIEDTKEKHKQGWLIIDQYTGANLEKGEGIANMMASLEKDSDVTIDQGYDVINRLLADGADRLPQFIQQKAFNTLTSVFDKNQMSSYVKSKLPEHVEVSNPVGFQQHSKMQLYHLLEDINKNRPRLDSGWKGYHVKVSDPAETYKKTSSPTKIFQLPKRDAPKREYGKTG